MTIDEHLQKIRALNSHLLEIAPAIGQIALQELLPEYKNRIFDDGRATDGTLIDSKVKAKKRDKAYSKGHARKRKKRRTSGGSESSLPIDKIYLSYDKTLSNSIEIGDRDGDTVLAFNNQDSADIAGYHEDYRKQQIFDLNDNEIVLYSEALTEGLQREVDSFME